MSTIKTKNITAILAKTLSGHKRLGFIPLNRGALLSVTLFRDTDGELQLEYNGVKLVNVTPVADAVHGLIKKNKIEVGHDKKNFVFRITTKDWESTIHSCIMHKLTKTGCDCIVDLIAYDNKLAHRKLKPVAECDVLEMTPMDYYNYNGLASDNDNTGIAILTDLTFTRIKDITTFIIPTTVIASIKGVDLDHHRVKVKTSTLGECWVKLTDRSHKQWLDSVGTDATKFNVQVKHFGLSKCGQRFIRAKVMHVAIGGYCA